MHEGRPAIARQTLARPHAAGELLVRNLLHIRLEDRGIHIGARPQLGVGQAEEISDVARQAIPHLDPQSVNEGDRGQGGAGLDRHLGDDPPAEGGADQRDIRQLHLVHEVEVEIGDVVHMIPAAVHGAGTKTGRDRDNDAAVLREALNERAIIREPQTGGKIKNIASLTMDRDGQPHAVQIQLDHFLTHKAAPFRGQTLDLLDDDFCAA